MTHFEVHFDYETSKRAGDSGMFQVVEMKDAEGSDKTILVDQGTHYSNLDDLRFDLAKSAWHFSRRDRFSGGIN